MSKGVLAILITLIAAIAVIIGLNLRPTPVSTLQRSTELQELSASETTTTPTSSSRINIGGTAITEITQEESTQTVNVPTRAIADINPREINFVQNTASGKLVTLKDGSELFVGSGAVEQLPPEVVFQADYVFEPSEYDE